MSRGIYKAVFALVIAAAIIVGFWGWQSQNQEEPKPATTQNSPIEKEIPPPAPEPVENPTAIQLKVPFTAQAPTANWDELHNEACEEASAIMAHAYFNNIASLPPAYVESEISKLTVWQRSNYGYNLSITTDETAEMIEANYNLETEIIDISEQAIKEALAQDKLVIVPAQGQMLGNPNFTPPGPVYHMFVITGYDETEFITNDPGTRKGENYRYTYETIFAATGNYDHGSKQMDLTDKRIIIVSKN